MVFFCLICIYKRLKQFQITMDDIFGKIGMTTTLSQKIERRIEEAIRQKKLVRGAKIPSERELCESFGVSRTAVREALRRLSARGLLEIRKGSGMYVSEIKIEDIIHSLNLYYDLTFDRHIIRQILDVRRLFEPQIAGLAAQNRTEKDLETLSANIKALELCDSDNTQLEVDTINRFHANVAKSTGNPIIIMTMEPIYTLLPRMRNFIYGNIDGEKETELCYQKKILDAITRRDVLKATEEMVVLLAHNQNVYDKYLSKFIEEE